MLKTRPVVITEASRDNLKRHALGLSRIAAHFAVRDDARRAKNQLCFCEADAISRVESSRTLGAHLLLCLLAAAGPVRGDFIALTPVADTTLFEFVPDNNVGAQHFLEAGLADVSGSLKRLRGLVRFDLSQIPTNAIISNAALRVTVVLANTNPYPEYLELHRLLQPWTEGNKSGGTDDTGPLGAAATAGESTWNHRQYPSAAWAAPGGSNGMDFVNISSGFTLVYSVSNYTFTGLAADVRQWVTNSAGNFGWMLKPTIETSLIGGGARRFGSREHGSNAPVLTVTYGVPRPIISTSSPLPTGTAGVFYSVTLNASGSPGPYTWSLDSGTLPGGLNLSTNGVLNGTPTEYGTFDFSVRVADPAGESSTTSFVLTINPGPLQITTDFHLPVAEPDMLYSVTLTATGGKPPYTWSLASGTLPDGITLSSAGVLSGIATTNAVGGGGGRGGGRSLQVQVADSLNAKTYAFLEFFVEPLTSLLYHTKLVGGQISFEMMAMAGYTNAIEFTTTFDTNDWTTLTNVVVPATTNVTIADPATGPARFYRFHRIVPGGGGGGSK
jgi:hypothetical protein